MSNESFQRIDWETALEQHRPWLRKVLRCRVGDQHAVDDLLQEISLAVIRQSSREAPAVPSDPERVAPWLYRLAVRQSINFHRRSGRKSAAKPMAQIDSFAENTEPLDWMLAEEERNATQQAMKQLRAQDREILLLKYTENWSYRQLARHLGVKERTVEYRLMRARQNLRNLLTRATYRNEGVSTQDAGQVSLPPTENTRPLVKRQG